MELSGYIYRCSAGESFDSVALKIYGSESHAPEIMDANPGLCGKMIFGGGEELKLPVVEQAAEDEGGHYTPAKAPWKDKGE